MGVSYKNMQNEELLDLLFSEGDRLPREAADEVIRRGQELLPMLAEIVMDRTVWTAPQPDCWAAVHGTYLIGSIGGRDAVIPLMSALRWADAYENEWITEDLPSILGSLGDYSWQTIVSAAVDRAAGWTARSIAMDALGAQAIRFPLREEAAMAILGGILKDESDDPCARRSAAFVLIDFRRSDLKDDLIAFANYDKLRQEQFPDNYITFSAEDVKLDLSSPRIDVDIYTRNWLGFYEPEEMSRRQERWREEERKMRADFSAATGRETGENIAMGRETPCPCGSGKPYKQCCLRRLH